MIAHGIPLCTSHADEVVVSAQLGRPPRGTWRVRARCPFGRPMVLETAPSLKDGSPFPTLYWLSCPWLVEYVNGLESAGATSEWAGRLRTSDRLAERMRLADAEYRARRAACADGTDPTPDVGIAGQSDPLATKCLHAHVATFLAGIDDPIGESVISSVSPTCPDDICARLDEVGQ